MKRAAARVVDTNVLIVANQSHGGVSPQCIIACVEALELIRKHGQIVLDDGYEILREYSQKTDPKTGNRVGDAFLKWLYQNIGNASHVHQVSILRHRDRGYAEFPEHHALTKFDHSDRKFIAVSIAHPKRPPVLQATDSKWMDFSDRLLEHGVVVQFLCQEDVAKFRRRKQSKRSN